MELNGNFGDVHMVVTGVIDDYIYGDMYGKPEPVVFFCMPKATSLLYVRMNPLADPEQALAKMERVFKKVNPGVPFEYTFVDDQFNALFTALRRWISGSFRVYLLFSRSLSRVLGCSGSLLIPPRAGSRRDRHPEGVGCVHAGDHLSFVQRLFDYGLRCFLVWWLFPVADWVMYRWLQGYSYRISLSWWIFAIAGGLAVFIALVTVSSQAIRAALGNPADSLRSE